MAGRLPTIEWGPREFPTAPAETSIELAQRDLFIYWSYVRMQPVPLTQAGWVQKRALRAINEQLVMPDPGLASASNESDVPRLFFLRLLLEGLELLTAEPGELRASASLSEVPPFWEQSLEQRALACLKAWTRMKLWGELDSLGMSSFDLDMESARWQLLSELRPLEQNIWISAERFVNRLAISGVRILFRGLKEAVATAYSRDPRYAAQQRHWLEETESAFVGRAVSGPLHWMGLVDVVVESSRLLAFRINPSGAPVIAAATGAKAMAPSPSALSSEHEARLIVQPNFQVLALGPVPLATLARLEVFADRLKADRSALEYSINRNTVYRGQRAGLSADGIIAFLEEATGQALPQNVRRTLEEWGAQHGRIVFHRHTAICHTANPELMEKLWSNPAVQAHLERQLTPTMAQVARGRVSALRQALLQSGLLPATSTPGDLCKRRILATEEGELRPVNEGADLLLTACLRALAEERDGRFFVTEAAVAQAISAGPSVAQYLERLAALHHGPLPSALQTRVKAWGRYYGQAILRDAVLLEVKDAEAADELLADPEIGPLLSRLPDAPRGRVLVAGVQDRERVQRMLRERGVELLNR